MATPEHVNGRSPAVTERALLALLAFSRLWSRGTPADAAEVVRVRTSVLEAAHARYVAAVPAYRGLAAGLALERPLPLSIVVDQLLLDESFFKSYDETWLTEDLPELTRWLDSVCTYRLTETPSTRDLPSWRMEMKRRGLSVTYSSGTTGRRSFIPRDRATLSALRAASGVTLPWASVPDPHDCLLVVPAGLGLGIQSGAAGLAHRARRAHVVRQAVGAFSAEDYARAVAFAGTSVDDGRPLLVYGGPAAVQGLVAHLMGEESRLRLPPGSLVVTGGGWKIGAGPEPSTSPAELSELVSQWLGVAAARVIDTYSTVELNTVLATCQAGRYHVPPSLEVVVLDEMMRPVSGDDVSGRLAFLDAFALSYPGFIATGDTARVRRDPCSCGLSGPTVVPPITRHAAAAPRGCGLALTAEP